MRVSYRFLSYKYLFSIFSIVFFLMVLSSCRKSPKLDDKNIVVKDVSVIPMIKDTVLYNKDVFIVNGKISDIIDTGSKNTKGFSIIKGKGLFMVPGLADMHVHFPKSKSEMKAFLSLYLINGITKIRSMRGSNHHIEWREEFNHSNSIFPKLYLSSPPISRRTEYDLQRTDSLIQNYKNLGFDFIKILSVKDEETFNAFNSSCRLYNFKIAGHFPSNVSDSLIFNSSITSLEHLGGLINVDSDLLENRINNIAENNITISPTLDWCYVSYSYSKNRINSLKAREGLSFISDSIISEWNLKTKKGLDVLTIDEIEEKQMKNDLLFKQRLEVLKKVRDKNILLVISPDNSSKFSVAGYGLIEEMKHYRNAGLSNYEILKTATYNVARSLNDESFGTIEKGKEADFILLNKNPLDKIENIREIEGVFNNIFLDKQTLNDLKNSLIN